MSAIASCVYSGRVGHKRLAPKQHAFSYRVFSLYLDVDALDALDQSLRFFSRNRFNLLGFCDRDFGDGSTVDIAIQTRKLLHAAGFDSFDARISLLFYPRILGYVFNPLSVYFCHDADDRLGVLIYEVSNTFGERKSYVIPVAQNDQPVITQDCVKELYVSPFTSPSGHYEFKVARPEDSVFVGVNFLGDDGSSLKTFFRGVREKLNDRAILKLILTYPLMTLKVVVGIHFEAARLWLKGVPLVQRHHSPPYSYTIVEPSKRDADHVAI